MFLTEKIQQLDNLASPASKSAPPLCVKEELYGKIVESVKSADSQFLLDSILEQGLVDGDLFWDLTAVMSPSLSTENLLHRPNFFNTIRRCLVHFSYHGRPKELVLAFLEQLEGFIDDASYLAILPCLQVSLLRLQVKREKSLELALDTVGAHITGIPISVSSYLDCDEQTSVMEMDRFLDVVHAFVDFMQPFVSCDSEEGPGRLLEIDLLKNHLFQLLAHPLVFMDFCNPQVGGKVNNMSNRSLADTVVNSICALDSDLYRLLMHDAADGVVELSDHPDRDFANAEIGQLTMIITDDDEVCDGSETVVHGTGSRHPSRLKLPVLSVACLAYLVQVEGFGRGCWPLVPSLTYLFHANLQFVAILLSSTSYSVVHKGLGLLLSRLDTLPDRSLDGDVMNSARLPHILNTVISLMQHCSSSNLRLLALRIFRTFFGKLGCQGKHDAFRSVLGSCDHVGVRAIVVGMLKNEIDATLRLSDSNVTLLSNPCLNDGISDTRLDGNGVSAFMGCEAVLNYFTGQSLEMFLGMIVRLPDGLGTDLLAEFDLIMSTLNLLRFLVLRDGASCNRTGIWSMVSWLRCDYLLPLGTSLDLSMAHYRSVADDLIREDCSADVENGNPEISIVVSGTQLPCMSREETLSVLHSILNTLDTIKCVLGRVSELVDNGRAG